MDIAKLKELVAAATPGPWAVCQDPPPNDHWFPGFTVGAANPKDARRVCDAARWDWTLGRANAALIVAAVNALPSLIARVEAADRLATASREFSISLNHYKRHCATETDTPEMVEAIDAAYEKWRAALTTYDQEKARG